MVIKIVSTVKYACICDYLNLLISFYICMYICTLFFIILKGIRDMTAKEVVVRVMTEGDFPDVPVPIDQLTQFALYNTDG